MVYDFKGKLGINRSSLIKVGPKGFKKLAPYVELIANLEGLHAHANPIKVKQS